MVAAHSRGGTFSPSPAPQPQQPSINTSVSHSPHPSASAFSASASASPSTSSPTGASSLTKIVVAQVYVLLSHIKEDKDRSKWESQAEQLRKLVDEHGMEVFQKYFTRLVVGNAGSIFPSLNRPVANPGNAQILVAEMHKIAHDVEQAGKIAESIETASEDLFRDFDLSTFMDHFKLDPLEKTVLALAFKLASRSDLKTKADAILSANYTSFLHILARPGESDHGDLTPDFLATVIDRLMQEPPPNFNDQAKIDLSACIQRRYEQERQDALPPPEVLAALYLKKLRAMDYPLVAFMRRIGASLTTDEETCRSHLRRAGNVPLSEEHISAALLYATLSRTPQFSVGVLVASLQKELPADFKWQDTILYLDQPDLRISRSQFLALYQALQPIATEREGALDLQGLWGGHWQYSETQLSFLNAYASLGLDQLDATTIPGLQPSFTIDEYTGAGAEIEEAAARAAKHPLVSVAAITAIFNVALQSTAASETAEAKRLFQEVVVPNLDTFLVSAFSAPRPWPALAVETVKSLFPRFLHKLENSYNFVMYSLWRKDKAWVAQQLVETHAKTPMELPLILEHAIRQNWLDELVVINNGFGLDLAALAHAKGHLDLERWQRMIAARHVDLTPMLLTFLSIKAEHEVDFQRGAAPQSMMLPVKTVWGLLHILDGKNPTTELTMVQRACIIAYPRLINYGEGFDDIIDANGSEQNKLPDAANVKMEEHYKRMYSDDLEVRNVVEALDQYKHSRDPLDQDVFACMIHGLFDEYALYNTYPLEALATTAVLFGGIICHKLISDIPLEIGLGMILDAVREYTPDASMFKFGLQALMQLFPRLREWPGFCQRLLQIPGLRGTEAWKKAEEVIRDNENQMAQNASTREMANGAAPNGNAQDPLATESTTAPFTAIHVGHSPFAAVSEDPSAEIQEKVLFVLNNITERNLDSKFQELRDVIDDKHRQWFAGHLVEERAKMQPNYHQLYLDLVRQFQNKALWSEVLRETYISVIRLLNAESTMQSSTERTHLKNLGGWLGSLTLARDKPIKHKNIAFKQLLLEAFDTQRLLVVIPFVCKVLIQGASSTVFKPPNPWLMDIIHLLIELYHHAELKLNLKFEIEVLCKGLNLDHKSIEPSTDIQTRSPRIEEPLENTAPDMIERFDNMSLAGMGATAGSGRFSPSEILTTVPDVASMVNFPQINEMLSQPRLQEIVRSAVTRAVHEIIAPVVERSVTIAAISTAQMIRKDFATEPDETRVRQAAIHMVKRTAGSLALVTSKEPLRASMNNYIRAMSQELPQGIPEGTIIMCVNANLDMACGVVEKKAEERAIPEIEEMIEPELEARRRHRMTRPNEPYVDPGLSRWAWTIPNPYKLVPNMTGGLNPEQMAIYDEFARQPRPPVAMVSHGPSSSDASRTITNDVLGETYTTLPNMNIPTPAETPSAMHQQLGNQQLYSQPSVNVANGRGPGPVDTRVLGERIQELVSELVRAAESASEQHYMELPRPHAVIDIVDALISMVIRSTQLSDDVSRFTAGIVCEILFGSGGNDTLAVESLVHVLDNLCKFSGRTARNVVTVIAHQPDEAFLNVPLVVALVRSDMGLLEWPRVDLAAAKALLQRKEGSIEFLAALLEQVLLNDRPSALRTDFARSLEALTFWVADEPNLEAGRALNQKLSASGLPQAVPLSAQEPAAKQEQMEYIFDEWVHLFNNGNATDKSIAAFVLQLQGKQVMIDTNETCGFLRLCIDAAVDRFEQYMQTDASATDAYLFTDALGRLIGRLVKYHGDRESDDNKDKAGYLMSILSLVVLILNNHHVSRGERFNQRVFFRLLSTIISDVSSFIDDLSPLERQQITLVFVDTLHMLQPIHFPGFIFGWIALLSHRDFLVNVMRLPEQGGWEPFASLMEIALTYLGELLKSLHLSPIAKDVYRGTFKFIVVLQHDYPEFLAANHLRLCAAIPGHCIQLRNMVLMANPLPFSKMPDPSQPGLKIDRMEEIRDAPVISGDIEEPIKSAGLLEILEQIMTSGPSEDAIAHMAHAIQRKSSSVGAGYMPINTDVALVDSIVLYTGVHAIAKAAQKQGPTFVPASPDAALLTMLARELSPESRYYLLNSIVNQLRFPNSHTHYFSQALLEIFGHDGLIDPEEAEIQQQITRILLERLIGQWPQPWGLLVTVIELVKNDSYKFFELPFIKSSPEVAERFMGLARPPL